MKSVTIKMKETLHIRQKMAHYIRPKHVKELTNKYIIQCYNLELILSEHNIVARKILNVYFKSGLSLQNSVFQTQVPTCFFVLYLT